jgi:hypothetical protein
MGPGMRLALLTPLLVLTLANNAHAAGYLPCFYSSRSEGFAEHADCARPAGDAFVIRKRHLVRMLLDENGLSGMLIGSQFFYVKPDGRMLPVVAYDNGPDYFAEGLTRAQINGKIGYYDRHFRQVIPPRYDWGSPFENGRAEVCNGCTVQPSDREGHSVMTGGRWGSIDKRGREIEPLVPKP